MYSHAYEYRLGLSALFVYNQSVKELIIHFNNCDSIHNREYHDNFYYRDSIIFTITQP